MFAKFDYYLYVYHTVLFIFFMISYTSPTKGYVKKKTSKHINCKLWIEDNTYDFLDGQKSQKTLKRKL